MSPVSLGPINATKCFRLLCLAVVKGLEEDCKVFKDAQPEVELDDLLELQFACPVLFIV